jgi:hypothetical protein
MFAARYTNNITRDFERGYSFYGWTTRPASSIVEVLTQLAESEWKLAEAIEDVELDETTAEEILNDNGYEVAFSEELNGWMPILSGLSAFTGDTVAEAVENAQADERFQGGELSLYVFKARTVDSDYDTEINGLNIAVVKPLGYAHKIS